MAKVIEIGLNAVIIAVSDMRPKLLVITKFDSEEAADQNSPPADSLPFDVFDPAEHHTFEAGLRDLVERQTAASVGYVEQLYTFGDRGRLKGVENGVHTISVGYLALTRIHSPDEISKNEHWREWYSYFPWEDWSAGRPEILNETILPLLDEWAHDVKPSHAPHQAFSAQRRLHMAFGLDGQWDEERVLERYELLYEAGLVWESWRDGREAARRRGQLPQLGRPMRHDHRRIIATAMSRLRAKLKYRPVIFELMEKQFTLTQLQNTVETISGHHFHKQNFRRLVMNANLVVPTGQTRRQTGGRPAVLYRFRPKVFDERPAPGLGLSRRGPKLASRGDNTLDKA